MPDALVVNDGLSGSEAMIRRHAERYRAAGISRVRTHIPARDVGQRINDLERAVEAIRGA